MQAIFNCCHGVLESQARWICTSHPSSACSRADEEIIGGEDGGAHRGHFVAADGKPALPRRPPGAPLPIGAHVPVEDDKETAKQRLQRLIRDFAHDAVGPGLSVEVQCEALQAEAWSSPGGILEAVLRMDRRLSRLEIWPANGNEGLVPMLQAHLQQVSSIVKGANADRGEADPIAHRVEHLSLPEDSCTLTVLRRGAPDLRLVFETPLARDRAYTCLRIFQMSVDQSAESLSRGESESLAADG